MTQCTHAARGTLTLRVRGHFGASRVVFVPSTTLNCSSLFVVAEFNLFRGDNSARHASCAHFDDGPGIYVLWQRSDCVSVGIHRELAGMDMLCSGKTSTLTTNHHDYRVEAYVGRDFQSKGCSLFALLATEWNQNAKNAIDTILLECKQEVQADFDWHMSLDYTPF